MGVSEKEARQGTFVLFKVGGKYIKAKIRSLNDTEDWLDEAAKVEEMAAKCNGRESQREYNQALADCVFGYDEDLPRADLEVQLTGEQLYEAFEMMRYRFNPFLSRKKKNDEKKSKDLEEGMAILGNLSPEMQGRALTMIDEGKIIM